MHRSFLSFFSLTAAVTFATALPAGGAQSTQFSSGKAAASQLGQSSLASKEGDNRGGVASATTLSDPSSVAVDPTTGTVFVADLGNNRVLRFDSTAALTNGAAAKAVLGQPNFTITAATVSQSRFSKVRSICCDDAGRLWVLDDRRVLRFDAASTLANGANADGVLGQANFTTMVENTGQSGLGAPDSLFLSVTGSLWVSSPDLNRVSRFASAATKSNGANADNVLGQIDFVTFGAATTQGGLRSPHGLAVDLAGNLYVADSGNHRVLVFRNADLGANGRDATTVLGQSSPTTNTLALFSSATRKMIASFSSETPPTRSTQAAPMASSASQISRLRMGLAPSLSPRESGPMAKSVSGWPIREMPVSSALRPTNSNPTPRSARNQRCSRATAFTIRPVRDRKRASSSMARRRRRPT